MIEILTYMYMPPLTIVFFTIIAHVSAERHDHSENGTNKIGSKNTFLKKAMHFLNTI